MTAAAGGGGGGHGGGGGWCDHGGEGGDVGDGGCEEKGGSPWGPRKQVILSGSISCVKDAVFEGNLLQYR